MAFSDTPKCCYNLGSPQGYEMIRANMILSEAATSHPDGTISMLRSGINSVGGDNPPFLLDGSLVVRFEAELADEGSHKFDIRCMDEDGAPVLQPISGQFLVPKGGGVHALILGVNIAFPKAGIFAIYLRVDNHELDSWRINVLRISEQGEVKKKRRGRK
jgi:hypothetical protein